MIPSPLLSSMSPTPTDENTDFDVKLYNTSFDLHDSNSTLCPTNPGSPCIPSRPALLPRRHIHNFYTMSSPRSCSFPLCRQHQQEANGQHEHESSSSTVPVSSHEAKDVHAHVDAHADDAQTKSMNLPASLVADTFGSPPSKSTISTSATASASASNTASREASGLTNALPHAPYPHGYPAPHHYGYGNPMRTHAEYAQAQAHAHHMHMQYYAHDMYHRQHHGMGSPPPYHHYYPPPPQDNENVNSVSHNDPWGSDSRPVAAAAAAAAKAVSEKKWSAVGAAGAGGEEQKNANSHVDSQSRSEVELNCKDAQLIPSPPPKKRKYVMNSSWDEHDDHAHLCAASPGIFRSPDAKTRAKGFGFVSLNFATLCFCILLTLANFLIIYLNPCNL